MSQKFTLKSLVLFCAFSLLGTTSNAEELITVYNGSYFGESVTDLLTPVIHISAEETATIKATFDGYYYNSGGAASDTISSIVTTESANLLTFDGAYAMKSLSECKNDMRGALLYNATSDTTVKNSFFMSSATTSATASAQGGVFYIKDHNLTIDSSSIGGFVQGVSAFNTGAIHFENSVDSGKTLAITNSVLTETNVTNYGYYDEVKGECIETDGKGYGGSAAIINSGTGIDFVVPTGSIPIINIEGESKGVIAKISDTFIGGNMANEKGGAIYAKNAYITVGINLGCRNNAWDDSGILNETPVYSYNIARVGGFAYLDDADGHGSVLNFNVAKDKVLTIGASASDIRTSDVANNNEQDSIAGTAQSVVNKINDGKLVINGTMNSFEGTLFVNGGTMEINNGLGAKAVNIAAGKTLSMTVWGDNTLSNTTLSFNNAGTFILCAASSLAENSAGYDISASGNTDYGITKGYGGRIQGNKFIVGELKTAEIASGGIIDTPIEIEKSGRLSIKKDASEDIVLNFSTESARTIESIADVSSSLGSLMEEPDAFVKAYAFDIELSTGDEVLLSYYIGDDSYKLGDFKIYHRGTDGVWTLADDVSDEMYDDGYLSFTVSHFSGYGISTGTMSIPEPSTYAAIFGALALGFAAYRRRK